MAFPLASACAQPTDGVYPIDLPTALPWQGRRISMFKSRANASPKPRPTARARSSSSSLGDRRGRYTAAMASPRPSRQEPSRMLTSNPIIPAPRSRPRWISGTPFTSLSRPSNWSKPPTSPGCQRQDSTLSAAQGYFRAGQGRRPGRGHEGGDEHFPGLPATTARWRCRPASPSKATNCACNPRRSTTRSPCGRRSNGSVWRRRSWRWCCIWTPL